MVPNVACPVLSGEHVKKLQLLQNTFSKVPKGLIELNYKVMLSNQGYEHFPTEEEMKARLEKFYFDILDEGTYYVTYTPKGKTPQIYTVKKENNRWVIYNKEDKEVFGENTADRKRIMMNVHIGMGEATFVRENGHIYVVYKNGTIKNEKGKAITITNKNIKDKVLKAAEEFFNKDKKQSSTLKEAKAVRAQLTDLSEGNAKLADMVFDTLQQLGIKFQLDSSLPQGVTGRFVASKKTIKFANNLLPNTLLHEAIHGVTSYYMEIADKKSLPKEIQVALKEIEECYELLKQDFIETHFYENGKLKEGVNVDKAFNFWIQNQDTYGYTNAKEMMAEVSNPAFLEHIRDYDRRHKGLNIFQKLIDAIFNLFQVKKKYKSLESTLKNAMATLIQNPSKEVSDRYSEENKRIKENISKIKNSKIIEITSKKTLSDIQSQLENIEGNEASVVITESREYIRGGWILSVPEGSHNALTKSDVGTIFYNSMGLYMFLENPVQINEDDTITIPLKVVDSKWLSTHTFKVIEQENGVSKITNIKEVTKEINTKPSSDSIENSTEPLPYYKGDIVPDDNTIFVFGSNPEGRHGAGSAKVAAEKFGAIQGQGEGLQGNSYALPTKDLRVTENHGYRSISPEQITESIKKLYQVAFEHPEKTFKVAYRTRYNQKGLNGYTGAEMMLMFNAAGEIPSNIMFSEEWYKTRILHLNYASKEQLEIQLQIQDNSAQQSLPEETTVVANIVDELNANDVINAVNKITTWFSKKVQSKLLIALLEAQELLDGATDFTERKAFMRELLTLTSQDVIKAYGVTPILNEVKEDLQSYLDMADTMSEDGEHTLTLVAIYESLDVKDWDLACYFADNRKKYYQIYLNAWDELCDRAVYNLALTEGITVERVSGNWMTTDEASETSEDNEGNPVNESNEGDDSKSDNENWNEKIGKVSAWDSRTNAVRREISNIMRVSADGTISRDACGDVEMLSSAHVHLEVLNALKDMTDSSEMIPLLEKAAIKKPWLKGLIESLSNDERLFTAFYNSYRLNYLNMWAIKLMVKRDGSTTFKTIQVTKPEGIAHYYELMRDNFDYGRLLSSTISLYDKNGIITVGQARVLKSFMSILKEQYDTFARQSGITDKVLLANAFIMSKLDNRYKIFQVVEAIKALGIEITPDSLKACIDGNTESSYSLKSLLYSIYNIANELEKGKDIHAKEIFNNQKVSKELKSITTFLNIINEGDTEASCRYGGTTIYAHTKPSFISDLVKKLRGPRYTEVLEEYKKCSQFYDAKHGYWRNGILARVAGEHQRDELGELSESDKVQNSKNFRALLNHALVVESCKKEYSKWNAAETFFTIYNMWKIGASTKEESTALYALPVLSDTDSLEVVTAPKYAGTNAKSKIIRKLADTVLYEYERIATVIKESEDMSLPHIASYHSSKKGDNIVGSGRKFNFFPELNTMTVTYEGLELSVIDYISLMLKDGKSEDFILGEIAKNLVTPIMDNGYREFINFLEQENVFKTTEGKNQRLINFPGLKKADAEAAIEQFFYNWTLAQSDIIQLTTGDLAFFPDLAQFCKRNKQQHAPESRLDLNATWNGERVFQEGEQEKAIYVEDHIVRSKIIDLADPILKRMVQSGKITEFDYKNIREALEEVNVADAQSYRSLKSWRKVMIGAHKWSDALERAYNNYRNGEYSEEDMSALFNTIKPYFYNVQAELTFDENDYRMVPTQHKNSEIVLMTKEVMGSIFSSPKFRAIEKFMDDNDIDVMHFKSVVKDGLSAPVKIAGEMYITIHSGGPVLVDESNEKQMYQYLTEQFHIGKEDQSRYVHERSWEGYGIQMETPTHHLDALVTRGTQSTKIVASNFEEGDELTYGKFKDKKTLTPREWKNYYFAINAAEIYQQYSNLVKIFKNSLKVQDLLIHQIRTDTRYGMEMEKMVTLNEEGEFTVPLQDPSQNQRIQSLLLSKIRNMTTTRKATGAALYQASCFGIEEDKKPRIVFGDDGNLKYVECWIPCPNSLLLNAMRQQGTHALDIQDAINRGLIPEDYLYAIGWRTPSEAEYSMLPLKIKGFISSQDGSKIILPEDITAIAGSDRYRVSTRII